MSVDRRKHQNGLRRRRIDLSRNGIALTKDCGEIADRQTSNVPPFQATPSSPKSSESMKVLLPIQLEPPPLAGDA